MVSHRNELSGALLCEWVLAAQWGHSFYLAHLLRVHSKFGLNYFSFHKKIFCGIFLNPDYFLLAPLKQKPGVLFLFSSN